MSQTLLNDLITDWISVHKPKKDEFQLLVELWQEVCPAWFQGVVSCFDSSKGELVIKVDNHLQICNIQFESADLLQKLNSKLKQKGQ